MWQCSPVQQMESNFILKSVPIVTDIDLSEDLTTEGPNWVNQERSWTPWFLLEYDPKIEVVQPTEPA